MTKNEAIKIIEKLNKKAVMHSVKLCNGYIYEEIEQNNLPYPDHDDHVANEIKFRMYHEGKLAEAIAQAEVLPEYVEDLDIEVQGDPRGAIIYFKGTK